MLDPCALRTGAVPHKPALLGRGGAVRLGAGSGTDKGCLWCSGFCASGGKEQAGGSGNRDSTTAARPGRRELTRHFPALPFTYTLKIH